VSDQFLQLELRLLILRYGRQRVLQALAQLGEQTPEEVAEQLRAAETKRKAKRPKPSVMDLVEVECREHPEIAEPLRTLAVGFQNRTFLPHLRDVQRLLERIGSARSKPRSRDAAAPVLVRALAGLAREDLLRLAAENSTPGESDYSLLARAIMRVPAPKPRGIDEPREKPADG